MSFSHFTPNHSVHGPFGKVAFVLDELTVHYTDAAGYDGVGGLGSRGALQANGKNVPANGCGRHCCFCCCRGETVRDCLSAEQENPRG